MGQSDLPLASGGQHVAAFCRAGWERRRQTGSHIILGMDGRAANLSIPDHKEVKRALLQKQIQVAGMTNEEYLDYFYKRRPGVRKSG